MVGTWHSWDMGNCRSWGWEEQWGCRGHQVERMEILGALGREDLGRGAVVVRDISVARVECCHLNPGAFCLACS